MKKRIKSILIAFMFVVSLPIIFACGKEQTLAMPKDLAIDKNTYKISWSPVDNADYYIVEINGKQFKRVSADFDATSILSGSGLYKIKVCAYTLSGSFKPSGYSDEIEFDNLQKLDTPTLVLSGYNLSWNAVENAEYYTVLVNGIKFVTMQNSFDIAKENPFKDAINFGEDNKFQVFCSKTSNYLNSDLSNTVSKYFAQILPEPTNVKVEYSNGYILSFNAPQDAQSFTLKIDEKTYIIQDTNLDISDKIGIGKHQISVKCNAVYDSEKLMFDESKFSEEVSCERLPSFTDQKVNDIKIENGTLTFSPLADALSYDININGTTYVTTSTTYDVSKIISGVGKYEVVITAKNGTYTSLPSEKYTYKTTWQLSKPTIEVVKQEDKILLKITEVLHATKYVVNINGTDHDFALTTIDISNLLITGTNSIYVTAIGDGDLYLDSVSSNIAHFIKVGAPSNLSVSNNVLTFDKVQGADGYKIKVDGVLIDEITENSVDLSSVLTTAKSYLIEVCAVFGEEESEYVSISYDLKQKLNAPINLQVDANEGRYLLSFDKVENASAYQIYVNGTRIFVNQTITQNNDIDITDSLSVGTNQIYVISVGDEGYYSSSNRSKEYTYVKTIQLEAVSNINVAPSRGKYYLHFDAVENATQYQIEIKDSNNKSVLSQFSTTTEIDIDSAITKTDEYVVQITAIGAEGYLESVSKSVKCPLKIYAKDDYQAKQFFFDGHDYTFDIKNQHDFEDFIFYSVLYRLKTAEVYIDESFDYANGADAYSSETSLLDQYIPSLSKYGVDINSSTDVLSQLFGNTENLSKLPEIIGLLEHAHDQCYLYFSATSNLTSQKSDRIYTITFEYKGTDEATKKNAMPNREQANLPVHYTTQNSTRTFTIDGKKEAPVETVAQLLMVVQNGRKPKFTSTNTTAEKTYQKARKVLSQICTDSMTDFEKAHAIHDYIVATNHYDNTTYNSATGTPFDSKNLDEMSFYASGMLLNNLSVCKGIAQAFVLMCNIEGIETIETFGLVGGTSDWSKVDFNDSTSLMMLIMTNQLNINTIGAHSWTRVLLDAGEGKQWYIVDPTWDDLEKDNKEYLSHEYFLANEDAIKQNRKELYPNGTYYHRTDSERNQVDYTAKGKYDYYTSTVEKPNTRITSQEILDTAISYMKQNSLSGIEILSNMNNIDTAIATSLQNCGISASDYEIMSWGDRRFICKK